MVITHWVPRNTVLIADLELYGWAVTNYDKISTSYPPNGICSVMKTSVETVSFDQLCLYLETHLHQAKRLAYRYPILLSGDQQWRHQIATKIQKKYLTDHHIWLSQTHSSSMENTKNLKASNVIGKEYQHIIIDIEHDFSPNLFAAISGALLGGGLFLILCPEISSWQKKLLTNHLFLWRIVDQLKQCDDVLCITQNLAAFNLRKPLEHQAQQVPPSNELSIAVDKIIHVSKGHRNRPLVLLADRGRGKSTALGLAAAKLALDGIDNIIITAPSFSACSIVFKHFETSISTSALSIENQIIFRKKLTFFPPDDIILSQPKTSLMLIDEAAGIPTPLLEKILNRYSRIVFSTTLHGYEGSGQSFPIKFFKILDRQKPGWSKFYLTQAKRWNEGDPLEKLIDRLFLLKPKITHYEPEIDIDNIHISPIQANELVNNELLLADFFHLLSSAHYKTQPSDLAHILEDKNINISIAMYDAILVGIVITINEGEINDQLSHEIYLGNRRPKGHLTPQTLLMHIGLKEAGHFKYQRIMRIAVKPELQSLGIGSLLVKFVTDNAVKQKIDFVSCSFGISANLFHFWHNQKFSIVRIGVHKKSSVNAYSSLLLKPLNEPAALTHNHALKHFSENFFLLLRENLHDLDCEITLKICENILCKQEQFIFDQHTWAILVSYSEHNRIYEDNIHLINQFARYALCQEITHKTMTEFEVLVFAQKTLYSRNWSDISKRFNLTGAKEAKLVFKKTLSRLIVLHKNQTHF